MAYRLPPLNALRLFEAAGRLLSFKAAAEELHLTPSAVSHGIQSLESWLGVALFERHHRALTLTPAGAAYLPQIRAALDLVVRAGRDLPGQAPIGRVSVSTAPSFGFRWLIPNLPQFQQRHPDIEVTLDTAHRLMEFPRDGVDLAIRLGRGDWPETRALLLTRERIVPVCAPDLPDRPTCTADLARHTLIHVTNVSQDWRRWLELTGQLADALDLERGLRFDNAHMALEAASRGLGIAMGRWPLIDADLAAGRLVTILSEPMLCDTGYWLVGAPDSFHRPAIAAFADWITQALK